jgi:hypothetical protein
MQIKMKKLIKMKQQKKTIKRKMHIKKPQYTAAMKKKMAALS